MRNIHKACSRAVELLHIYAFIGVDVLANNIKSYVLSNDVTAHPQNGYNCFIVVTEYVYT